jgi:small subunit ribosomal protein S16
MIGVGREAEFPGIGFPHPWLDGTSLSPYALPPPETLKGFHTMAVHIRLARAGAKKRPFYRIIVADHRAARGGRFIETIGTYHPGGVGSPFKVESARLAYWRGQGATPSATLDRLLKRQAKAEAAAAAAVAASGTAA